MNYSKDSRAKSEKKNNDTQKKMRKKSKVVALRIVLMACIIALFAIVGSGLGIFIGIIKSTPDVSQLDLKPTTNYTSFVFDSNKKPIDSFSGAENRIYVTLDKIPDYLQKAFIALEDERFYEHNGIDAKGIFRAIFKNLKSGGFSEGASTITQQLIKNNILKADKKLTRKIQEQYLAVEFEKLYSKDLILEYYLNTIALGHGVNGVQAASNRYFNKDVSDLTLAESAVIAVITQAPTRYSPILHPDNNKDKMHLVLSKMLDQGYISEEEMQAALKEDPYANIQKVHQEFAEKSSRSYFVDAVMEQVIDDLQSQKSMTRTKANNLIYGGGLQIYTTLDTRMQQIADKYINDESLYPNASYELKLNYSVSVKKANGKTVNLGGEGLVKSEADIDNFKKAKLKAWGITLSDTIEKENLLKQPQPQAAFVLMDYRTGQVKALAGGRGDKQDRGFNYATQATRQPGSAFKILAAYAPALDTGKLSPGSTIIDEPITIKQAGSAPYSPKNWNGRFEGPTSVRRGIYNSMNVLAVKTIQLVGFDTAYDYLLNFGFTTLSPTDKVYALPLGGLTKGVTPLELNAAYGAIANDGVYMKPILYTKVLDKDGHVLLDNTSENAALKSHQVIKETTAHMLTDMMQDVVNVGTGARLKQTFKSMPVAGKTGTTTDDKDLVFAGYTPYYAATIWTGHDMPKKLRYSYSYHLDIWGKIMNEVHEGLPSKSFPKVNISKSSGVTEVQICTLSGKIATDLCKADPNHVVKTEFFNSSNMPKDVCDVHVQVDICTISNKIANEFCPKESIVKKSFIRDPKNKNSDVPTDICDIHGPEGQLPTDPLDPNIPVDPNLPINPSIPTNPGTPANPTNPATPVTPGGSNPPPALPPVVDPNPAPNPDDQDSFFVPQG